MLEKIIMNNSKKNTVNEIKETAKKFGVSNLSFSASKQRLYAKMTKHGLVMTISNMM